MEEIRLIRTDGSSAAFREFYAATEAYYTELAGGADKRREFIPHNLSESIPEAVIAYIGGKAAGCCGLRPYSERDIEIKRLWVDPAYRGRGVAGRLMDAVEARARELGFERAILQTRSSMTAAVALYTKRGYIRIPNYPPYDRLEGAVCCCKELGIPDS